MKNILLPMVFILFMVWCQAKEVTGIFQDIVISEGIAFTTFKINGEVVQFEGIFDEKDFEKRQGEPMMIVYDKESSIADNIYFRDGTNANHDKTAKTGFSQPHENQTESIEKQFMHGTYKGILNHPVTLKNGKWHQGDSIVTLKKILSQGDMTGDGKAEHIVLLASSGGGSGQFWYVVLMGEKHNKVV